MTSIPATAEGDESFVGMRGAGLAAFAGVDISDSRIKHDILRLIGQYLREEVPLHL